MTRNWLAWQSWIGSVCTDALGPGQRLTSESFKLYYNLYILYKDGVILDRDSHVPCVTVFRVIKIANRLGFEPSIGLSLPGTFLRLCFLHYKYFELSKRGIHYGAHRLYRRLLNP